MISTLSVPRIEEVWQQYKATGDPKLREWLILQYTPLVNYVIGRMSYRPTNILSSDDLVSHAMLGLIGAVEKFDPDREVSFQSYAYARIRGSVLDAIRRFGDYPRMVMHRMRGIEVARSHLEGQYGRDPTAEEVANYLGMSIEAYSKNKMKDSFHFVSLDQIYEHFDEKSEASLKELIGDPDSPSPMSAAEQAEMKAVILEAMQRLPERERTVVGLHYFGGFTMKEISRVFNVSECRMYQLRARALIQLKRLIPKGD